MLFKKKKHDLEIYQEINSIINGIEIDALIKDSYRGCVNKEIFWKADALNKFIRNSQNKFLNNKLNILLSNLLNDLNKIANLYALCGKCDCVGVHFKLLKYRTGAPEEIELVNKTKKYSNDLELSYSNFYSKIKRRFKI